MDKLNKNSVYIILAFLLLLNIFVGIAAYHLSQIRFFEVNFFDVGQGDSAFIETPVGHQVLIDGGPGSVILEKLANKMPFWDRTIDLIILSHPDSDHLSGLVEVLKRYKVENILWTGVVYDDALFKEWENLIKKEGAKIIIAESGKRIIFPIGKTYAKIDVLYPFENLFGQKTKDANNLSLVSRLVFGKTSFIFTGDIYDSAESEIINKNEDIKSDVLKVAHHGSKTSTSEEFLGKVQPQIAVVSVGKDNKYGHPQQEVLDTLLKYGIMIFRTDLSGDIKIISDGNKLKTYAVPNF